MRGFEAMACGFLLLTWSDTVRLWRGTYFWLHTLMLTILALSVAGVIKSPHKRGDGGDVRTPDDTRKKSQLTAATAATAAAAAVAEKRE